MERRKFLKNMAIGGTILSAPNILSAHSFMTPYPTVRIPKEKRNFVSPIIEDTINEVQQGLKDKELGWLFGNCFPNTLDTTVSYKEKNNRPDTFVITGDIHAMWLRDSSAQVWPYLQFIQKERKLQKLIAGVINRQTYCISIDPYANAFNEGPTGSEWDSDETKMNPYLHERKYELDSLCYPIRLAYHYWKISKDTSPFDKNWESAMKLAVDTMETQQRKEGHGPYSFMRKTSRATDTLPGNGYGNPVNPVGLIVSSFRPSDDATIFPFLVPSNLFAIVSLRQLAEMSRKIKNNQDFALRCESLANEVEKAVQKYAVQKHLDFGKMYAFEVDGFGNRLFIDDSNIPSLLSLPYLEAVNKNDRIYKNTRQFLMSEKNPYFFKGKAAEGNGSPHTPYHNIWPMSIIMRAMTTEDVSEVKRCLNWLKKSNAGTGFMHESFNMDNPKDFTRSWFAWTNTLFGELIFKLYSEYPEMMKKEVF